MKQHRILVLGNSLFVQAITSGLQNNPVVDVLTLEPRSPSIGLRLRQTNPALLILEIGGERDLLTSDLFVVDVPILVVNIQSGLSKLLTGEPLPIVATNHKAIGSLAPILNQIEMGNLPPFPSSKP